MTRPRLAVIVEGHGEESAAPELLRRIAPGVEILRPHRVRKSKMPVDLARAVRFQSNRVGAAGGVLVLVDADDDVPEELEGQLLRAIDDDLRSVARVVVAVKEYEAWFLAGIDSLRSHRSVRDDAAYAGDPESPRDAKGRLETQMVEPYQETIHQVAFSAKVDLEAVAARCPSFVRLRDVVSDLLGS